VSEAGRSVLAAREVVKKFSGPDGSVIEVLNGANLSVSQGESLSIRGESGSGKSTFLNVISWLDQPDGGSVVWDGTEVPRISSREIARRRSEVLGFVFQSYCLMPELDVLENVLMATRVLGRIGRPEKERAENLLCQVGLQDRLKQLPGKLSGGERQRVAIARALINRPSVLLADEPTGNLDEKTADTVMELLLHLCRDETAALVLVTHNPLFAKRADRQVTLSGGRFTDQ
jgi:lipoprotein-releasing system ATP-binding protein